ncbi:hypothetical protein BC938DRAFT_478696 [Jimgerdemannia flammicorona]|uniref:MICOS complex subunit MIC12 n=1 Tax=Jimgerdemannia flammicorona TaxID=994334 RepID=A0A433QMH1_9FUNG|nr:hypothetical protein BC938DRAFT_478696 [Jimgerdemannia flammicorona]
MPKTISIVTGLLAASALAWQFRYDLEANTDRIRTKLHGVQKNLEGVVPEGALPKQPSPAATHPPASTGYTSSFPLVTNTHTYVRKRLVPHVKHTWNDHVHALASHVTSVDVPKEAHRLFVTHVLGDEPKKK